MDPLDRACHSCFSYFGFFFLQVDDSISFSTFARANMLGILLLLLHDFIPREPDQFLTPGAFLVTILVFFFTSSFLET